MAFQTLLMLALAAAPQAAGTAPVAAGVVVGAVKDGFAAHAAGLQPGDVLLFWERAPAPPANPEAARGVIASPFALEGLEIEHAPRGPVTLLGSRGGEPLAVRLPPGAWGLETLAPARAGGHTSASWRFLQDARAAGEKREWARAEQAFLSAEREAEAAGDLTALASVHRARGKYFESRNDWDKAGEAFGRALEAHRARGPAGLGEAEIRQSLGFMGRRRGDLAAAEAELEAALALQETLAPGSLPLASTLSGLGTVANIQGDLPVAEQLQRRALAIQERVAPDSLSVASTLNNLGAVLRLRAELAAAEECFQRALAIRERIVPGTSGAMLGNLGNVALARGDLDAAEHFYRGALAVQEKFRPGGVEMAASLSNLGEVAAARGDLPAAQAHYERALAIKHALAPGTATVAITLTNVGAVARERGDLAGARGHLQRARAIYESLANRSVESADNLHWLGEVELAAGDLPAAEGHHRAALEIRRERAPGSADEAKSCQRLATIHRRRNELDAALSMYGCALAALDAQRRTLGGTDEARARFGTHYAAYYRETVDLLVGQGRAEEAFHVLERYRARGLLSLLAERDLVFSADVPEDLDRARRLANAEYDRAFARLGEAQGAEVAKRREALDAIRRRQASIQERIRAASPRLAALQYPEPLDLPAVRRALDAGTLLLSYSIGEERSLLFAVGPGPDDFAAVRLDATAETLRRDVSRFRELLTHGGTLTVREVRRVSRRLSDALLAPVASQIARAGRLMVLPDGPLHLVPFAALADPAAPATRYLGATRPIHLAASATVFAELARKRRPRRAPSMVAFGDPDYAADAARGTRVELRPLPATRAEVEALAAVFPAASATYVGAEATEEKAKAVGEGPTLLHFACHGLTDEEFPLDSSLALSLPPAAAKDRDNGLLQAWEIFERMRIDADLVTLSACGTGLGRSMSGEGVLGLTRAFQYAGARTVLASLWAVNDRSTADLMTFFYGNLRRGQSTAEALRAAQVAMMRRPSTSHPSRWAAFQLVGDWQ
jgi:CHAT domain-containing protein/Tfp pilus assembly protein PilF